MRNILALIVFSFFSSPVWSAGSNEPSEILEISYREVFLNQDRAWTRQNVAGNNFDFIMGFAPELNIKIRSARSKEAESVLLEDIGAGKDIYLDSFAYRLLYENGMIRMYLPNWEWEGQAYLNTADMIRTVNNLAVRVLFHLDEYGVLIEDFEDVGYVVLLKNDIYGRVTVFRLKEQDLDRVNWFDKNGSSEFGILKRGESLVFYQK